MSFKKIIILIIFIFTLIGSLVLYVKSLDFNQYKTDFERLLMEVSHMDTKVNGDVKLSFWPAANLMFNDVNINDEKKPLVKINYVYIPLLDLFNKEKRLSQIKLSEGKFFF